MSDDTLTGTPDRVTIEIVTQRLQQITTEIADALERIGGTVNTAQMKDYIAALYRGDGALISAGERASWHTYCAGQAVHEVIRRFGGEIGPGDMYLLNDPYLAAVHQSDMYLVSPITFESAVVAWSATFVHVMDVGAMSPGGNSPGAREAEHEGLRFGAVRVVERGNLCGDVVDLLAGMTRQPEMVGLDIRCQLAANSVARERVGALFGRYGAALLQWVFAHSIATSQRVIEERLADISDCELTESLRLDITPAEHVTLSCTLRKQQGSIEFDLTRSSAQSSFGVNLPYHATFGACAQAIFDSLGRDLPKNEGLFAPVSVRTAPGSVVSCLYPAPVSLNTTSGGAAAKTLAQSLVSRMMASSPRWRSAARQRCLGHRIARHAGQSQHGHYYVSVLQSLNGGGATISRDGFDCSSSELTTHNVEWLEANFPLLQVYRRLRRDSGGVGCYRGGTAEEDAYVIHGPVSELRLVTIGAVGNAAAGHGMTGGYPGWPSELLLFPAPAGSPAERNAEQAAARAVGAMDLEGADPPAALWYDDLVMRAGDLLVLRSSGGPGSGDPITRPVGQALRDVRLGRLSVAAAANQYGVVIVDGQVDEVATAAARSAVRDRRRLAAAAAGWQTEEGAQPEDGCDPAAGVCARAAQVRRDGTGHPLPSIRVSASDAGWRWATGHPEPGFEQTLCPSCWSLVDVLPDGFTVP